MKKFGLFGRKDSTASEEKSNPYKVPKPEREEHGSGVETEEYDILPPIEQEEGRNAEYTQKDGIAIEYSFKGDDIREGLKIYQRQTIFKKNLIYSLLLGAVFAIYVTDMVMHPEKSNTLYLFLAALCVTVVCFLWYLPAKHVKKTAEAADQTDMHFKMTVFDTGVRIAEENGSFIIEYGKEITKIIETQRQFLLCVGKERLFMLPKRYIPEESVSAVREDFRTGMGAEYIDQTANA